MNRKTVVSIVAVALFALAASAGAATIPIVNAGFEQRQLVEDAYDYVLDGEGWGWSGFDDELGIWNPTTEFWATPNGAPEGNMVGYVYTDTPAQGGLAQILSTPLTANTRYTLTVEVGNSDWYVGYPGYLVELAAGGTQGPAVDIYPGEVTGGTTLVADNNLTPPGEDTFTTVSLSYTAPPIGDPLLGQPLQIRLFRLDGAEGLEVEFDNVRLEAISTVTALVWRTDFTGDWPTVNWTPDGGTNWVAPAGGEKMIVDSATGWVYVDSDFSATPALSLAIAETTGGTVDIGAAGSLAVTGNVAVGPGGTLNVDGSLTASAINADGGTLFNNRAATASTGVLTISASLVNAAAPITITDRLNIGDEPTISVVGGSFGISGADLLDDTADRTLTLQGGTVRMGGEDVADGAAIGVNFRPSA